MNKKPIWQRIDWVASIPFIAMHVALITLFFVPFSWTAVALAAGWYFVRMFAITAGYHRYFSHKSYKMGRIPQFLMALLGTMCMEKGVLWWAANHRHHHRYSDMPEDIHSPKQDGFLWSQVGWILAPDFNATRWELIKDLSKYPELVWLNKHFLLPCFASAIALYFIGGMSFVAWGFVASTVFLWHATFTINSLAHVFGSRRFETTDTSRNNFWLALLTLGEGWHNNHHRYMSSTRQGFFWWEIDISYYILKGLSLIGITKELREPPRELLIQQEHMKLRDAAAIAANVAASAAVNATRSKVPVRVKA